MSTLFGFTIAALVSFSIFAVSFWRIRYIANHKNEKPIIDMEFWILINGASLLVFLVAVAILIVGLVTIWLQ